MPSKIHQVITKGQAILSYIIQTHKFMTIKIF